MNSKPVVPRALAAEDIDDALQHYLNNGTIEAASGFIDELEQAYHHLGLYPASGSPRYAHELNLPGLRCWPLNHFPYLIFYVGQKHSIDVWRLLHSHRDIPAWMGTTETTPADR